MINCQFNIIQSLIASGNFTFQWNQLSIKAAEQRKRKKSLFCWKRRKGKKKSRNFSSWLFRDKWNKTTTWENRIKQYSREILKILHLIWKEIGTCFRFYKHEWSRPKRYRIFRFACKSQIKEILLWSFAISRSRFHWKVEFPEAITDFIRPQVKGFREDKRSHDNLAKCTYFEYLVRHILTIARVAVIVVLVETIALSCS